MFTTPTDRHFYGHGVFASDGHLLFTTENDFAAEAGVIGIWDVTGGFKRIGESLEQRFPIVMNHRGFAMHQLIGTDNLSPKGIRKRLMPQTHSQDGKMPGKTANDIHGNSRFLGCTRAG